MTVHDRPPRRRPTTTTPLTRSLALAAAAGLPLALLLPSAPSSASTLPPSSTSTLATGAGGQTGVRAVGEEQAAGRLELLLDSSGSMAEPADGGVRKIDAAKTALHAVVGRVPAGVGVGMRVYGARGKAGGNACTDSQAVVPIGSADAAQRGRLDAAIDRYSPRGETPISYSLGQAANDLGPTGRRTIVLVSDGEETCKADPCATARTLAARGVDLKIDVVGLKVDAATRKQLQCVADAGHGTYYDADSAAELASSLQVSTVRAFRPFRLTGTPVKGAVGNAAMPVIAAGQYLDTMPATSDVLRYRIRKPAGGAIWISSTIFLSGVESAGLDGQTMKLTDAAGQQCAHDVAAAVSQQGESASSVAELATGPDVDSSEDHGPCAAATELVLSVHRGTSDDGSLGGDRPAPFELVVVTEPPLAQDPSMPPPARQPATVVLPTTGTPVPIVGGASFSDAPVVPATGGTDTIRPGEALVYKVPIRYGQQPVFRLDVGAADAIAQGQIDAAYGRRNLDMQLRNPMRSEVSSAISTYGGGVIREAGILEYRGDPQTVTATGPQVRFLNRTSPATGSVAREGFYYLWVTLAASGLDTAGFSVPITVRGAALGTPSGAPAPATGPAATGSPTGSTAGTPATPAPTTTPTTDPTGQVSESASTAATTDPGTAGDATSGADTQAGQTRSVDASNPGTARRTVISVAGIGVVAALVLLALALLRRPRQQD